MHAVLQASVSGVYADLVTRPTGRVVRERPAVLVLSGITDGHREAIEPVLSGHGLAALIEQPDGTLEVLGAAEAAAALLDELVARRFAARTPGGSYALTLA